MMLMMMLSCFSCPTSLPGGNQVDGLPPASHLGPTRFEIALSQRLGHLTTFPLARMELYGQSLCHLNLSSFG